MHSTISHTFFWVILWQFQCFLIWKNAIIDWNYLYQFLVLKKISCIHIIVRFFWNYSIIKWYLWHYLRFLTFRLILFWVQVDLIDDFNLKNEDRLFLISNCLGYWVYYLNFWRVCFWEGAEDRLSFPLLQRGQLLWSKWCKMFWKDNWSLKLLLNWRIHYLWKAIDMATRHIDQLLWILPWCEWISWGSRGR